MSQKVAIYARCSTNKQTVDNQILELKAVANQRGYQITQIYQDEGISGSKGISQRPALDAMMKDAVRGKFNQVMVFDLTRLGRSLTDLLSILQELQKLNVDLFMMKQGIDTTTQSGKLTFSIIGAFAEFEREMIRSRVIAGQKRAAAEGKHIGRPTKMNDGIKNAIIVMRDKGMGIKQIAKTCGVGIGSVYKALPMPQVI